MPVEETGQHRQVVGYAGVLGDQNMPGAVYGRPCLIWNIATCKIINAQSPFGIV